MRESLDTLFILCISLIFIHLLFSLLAVNPLSFSSNIINSNTFRDIGSRPTNTEPGPPVSIDIDLYLRDNGHKGDIIFPESEKMKVGVTKTLTAYITKNISEVIDISDEKYVNKNITVTNQMEVTLTDGDGAFNIIPTKVQRQYVGEKVTEWVWLVTPLKSGKHTLKLNVYVVFENTATSYGENLSTYKELEQTIDVDANYIYNIESNWQWIIATIIALLSAIGIKDILNYKKN